MYLHQRAYLYTISLIATLVVMRIFLTISPSTNLSFYGYNIHHLFIGAFLIIVITALFILNIFNKFTVCIAGVSSALILDEIVYLIVTDGSDASYITFISLLGAIILTCIILLILIIGSYSKRGGRK